MNYPKRLIEVDLPIKTISEHARNEKNLRSGHPWHLHIWWARRPWGACRAVALASLLPDPVDPNCPESFVRDTIDIFSKLGYKPKTNNREDVRDSLLRFIGDYSQWELGSNQPYASATRSLVKSAHPDKPIVFDSFAGNGAIPGEALRLGCDAIALDLNPVANLVLRTLLQAVPRHGVTLLEEFRTGAEFIKNEAEKRLSKFYSLKDGKKPIAYLWARTVTCEAPGCGAEIPLISQTTLANGKTKVWIEVTGNQSDKTVSIEIKKGDKVPTNLIKTAGGGAAVCPVCHTTNPKTVVKRQGKEGRMGHRLYSVVVPVGQRQGKEYFNISEEDKKAFELAQKAFKEMLDNDRAQEIEEPFVLTYGLHVPPHYGISKWGHLFSERQKLALFTIAEILADYKSRLIKEGKSPDLIRDVITSLALGISNGVHYMTTMSTWLAEHMISSFITGNAIAMRWDWAEGNPLVESYVGGLDYAFKQAEEGVSAIISGLAQKPADVLLGNAAQVPLPDDCLDVYFTDPPYYDVVPYADLSDLCYVWLKRFLKDDHSDLFTGNLTPKAEQIVVNPYAPQDGRGEQSHQKYQERMTQAFGEGRRVLKPDGIGVVVFAHKGTEAWESLIGAIIDAGFIVTASWPIDTERASRMRANDSSVLGSSIHIVVRPRENPDGSVRTYDIGDWRDVLQELPGRIREWMKRLAKENVVGADAIFACLGPALEIFSRYSKVEKASGEEVTLKEYLEHVWAVIAREALGMIFEGADATGFEEDARLTAMWLWTLSAGKAENGKNGDSETTNGYGGGSGSGAGFADGTGYGGGTGSGAGFADGTGYGGGNDDEGDEDTSTTKKQASGYFLEYDAARKIAQGLGAHLEKLDNLVEVKGDKARLLPVSERVRALFRKTPDEAPVKEKKKAKKVDVTMTFEEIVDGFFEGMDTKTPQTEQPEKVKAKPSLITGKTMLDKVHQSMILFGLNRSEALRRFIVDDGVGKDARFWKLAQSLSALYPSHTEEKRWVDGVLARKKGFGF